MGCLFMSKLESLVVLLSLQPSTIAKNCKEFPKHLKKNNLLSNFSKKAANANYIDLMAHGKVLLSTLVNSTSLGPTSTQMESSRKNT